MPVPRPRLIVEALPGPGESVRLPADEAAHARARRLSAGSEVVLIDGTGREAAARVLRVGRGGVELRVEEVAQEQGGLDASPLHLLVAAVRAERLGWIAEKAAELGAARLTVVATERTQAFRARDGVLARLERLARASAKQAGASRFTTVAGPTPLSDALHACEGTRLLLDPAGEPFPERLGATAVSILVGPEGGLTDGERAAAREAGWLTVALPAGIVRAETAAIAALVLARAALTRR